MHYLENDTWFQIRSVVPAVRPVLIIRRVRQPVHNDTEGARTAVVCHGSSCHGQRTVKLFKHFLVVGDYELLHLRFGMDGKCTWVGMGKWFNIFLWFWGTA